MCYGLMLNGSAGRSGSADGEEEVADGKLRNKAGSRNKMCRIQAKADTKKKPKRRKGRSITRQHLSRREKKARGRESRERFKEHTARIKFRLHRLLPVAGT